MLPRNIDDLAEWSVYADHLLTIGDPLGDRIAADLALPAAPTTEQLRGFRALVGRHTPSSQSLARSWCLGFIHTLELRTRDHGGMFSLQEGALAQARDVLQSRAASRLEELLIPAPTGEDTHYRRVFRALPPSCKRVTLTELRSGSRGLELFLACLPPTVAELGIQIFSWDRAIPSAVLDRFDLVDIAGVRRMDQLDDLGPALAATTRVRVRIGAFHGLPPARMELGGPRDAGIVALDPRSGRYVLGHPPKLVPLEARAAWMLPRDRAPVVVMPVREWLAAESEIKNVCLVPDAEHPKLTLMRRDGAWTAKSWAQLSIDGQSIEPKTVVPIRDGARFEIEGRRGVFVARDTDAQCRAYLGSSQT